METNAAIEGKAGYKPVVYVVGFIGALSGLLFGLDVGVISGALPNIAKHFHASTIQQELVVSALLWGAVAGTLLSGSLSRKFGRKVTLSIAAVVFSVGSLLCSVSTTVEILIACRLFLGLAVGVASFTAPLYLAEIAPRGIRGGMISCYQLMITIGIVIAYLSDTYFGIYASLQGVVGGHWRIMLGIISIPAMFLFLGVCFLPRSPRWLLLRGRGEEAKDVIRRMRSTREEAELEYAEIEESLKIKQSGWDLFRTNKFFRKAIFMGIGLQVIQQLTGINVVIYYAPSIFKVAGFVSSVEQMWGTMIVGLVNVFSTFIAIGLVDRWGRKPIMYTGFVVMGISMCIVGLAMPSHAAIAAGTHPPAMAFVSIAALITFIIGFAASAGPIIWVICSEIYPLSGRDFGITCSTATNWIVNGIVGLTFLSMLRGLGALTTFLFYGSLEVLFIIFFILFVPETKGISLEKIAGNLMAGKRLRDIGR